MTHDPTTPPLDQQSPSDDQLNPILIIFLILPLLGIIAALGMIVTNMRADNVITEDGLPDSATNPAELINYQAPDFELRDLNGQPVALQDYRGKILFLNFWQTTCPPCIEEMPDFIAFMHDQPDDVTWLTVNFNESAERVQTFFDEHNFLGIPVVLDPDSTARYQYGVYGAPVTFILDADGIVRHMNIGRLTYDDMLDYVNALRES